MFASPFIAFNPEEMYIFPMDMFLALGLVGFLVMLWLLLWLNRLNERLTRLEKSVTDLETFHFERNRRDMKVGSARITWRAPQHLTATLIDAEDKHPVMLLDLSKTGVLLQTQATALEISQTYEIVFGEGTLRDQHLKLEVVRQAGLHQYGCVLKDVPLAVRKELESLMKESARQEVLQDLGET